MELALKVINEVAEVELVYKATIKPSQRPMVTDSREAYNVLKANWDENKIEFVEQFKVMFLNRARKVTGIYEMSSGGPSGTVADPKLIFIAALKMNANSIIIAHNHPSGSLKPSKADEVMTQKIRNAGLFLDLPVVDHLIISSEGYLSFADEGLL